MEELKILSPCGILGYGYPEKSFRKGLEMKPDLIAVDAGSTDAGPHKLGAGVGIVSKRAAKRDLSFMLEGGHDLKIPVIIGSAGGSGAKPHVEWTLDIVEEIAKENDYKFKVAIIWADIDKDIIKDRMKEGKVHSMPYVPELTEEDVDRSNGVVGQMGHEPIIKALEEGAEVIIVGRAYDPSVFAAYPIMKGFDGGLAYHMGKILECGALCTDPGTTKDCIMGTVRKDHFVIEALNPERTCHPTSIAAHTLYEKDHPYHLLGPGTEVDLLDCKFEQLENGAVKVSGSKMIVPEQYTVKMEGAAKVAYRTMVVGGIRDPITIANIDQITEGIKEQIADDYSDIPASEYEILFHIYGKNGVMGELEPVKEVTSHELGVVMEVVAKTQEIANTLCATARSTFMHYPYKGRKATAGNLALLYSPSDIECGPVYKFLVYHLIDVQDGNELFNIEYMNI